MLRLLATVSLSALKAAVNFSFVSKQGIAVGLLAFSFDCTDVDIEFVAEVK